MKISQTKYYKKMNNIETEMTQIEDLLKVINIFLFNKLNKQEKVLKV